MQCFICLQKEVNQITMSNPMITWNVSWWSDIGDHLLMIVPHSRDAWEACQSSFHIFFLLSPSLPPSSHPSHPLSFFCNDLDTYKPLLQFKNWNVIRKANYPCAPLHWHCLNLCLSFYCLDLLGPSLWPVSTSSHRHTNIAIEKLLMRKTGI